MVCTQQKLPQLLKTISNIPSWGINDQVPINRTINHFRSPISNTTPSYSQKNFTIPLHHLTLKDFQHTRFCCRDFLKLESHLSLDIIKLYFSNCKFLIWRESPSTISASESTSTTSSAESSSATESATATSVHEGDVCAFCGDFDDSVAEGCFV